MTPAERQRLYRNRVKRGLFVCPVEVDADALSFLEAAGLLKPDEAGDPVRVGEAVAQLLSRYA